MNEQNAVPEATKTVPSLAARIVGWAIVVLVLAPWRAVLLPIAILGAVADWYAFTADRWLQGKVGPVDSWLSALAWRNGNRAARWIDGRTAP